MNDYTNADPEDLAKALARHDDYRIVRRYHKPERYAELPQDHSGIKTGIYLDTETTGFDSQADHIIELAMVKFEFSSDGTLYGLGDEFNQLNDPGIPIPAEITTITGITDDMVAGERIDADAVDAFIADAAIIIAHNAAFDRKFVEASYAGFEKKAWGCSVRQVDWHAAGFESAKLEYLAYRQGFFFSGHRATVDCLAGIHVLSYTLEESGKPALSELLHKAREKSVRLWAAKSPFESKDLLKARGYRWHAGDDGRPKAWYKDLPADDLESEQEYLAEHVYGGRRKLPLDQINAFNRFSARI